MALRKFLGPAVCRNAGDEANFVGKYHVNRKGFGLKRV